MTKNNTSYNQIVNNMPASFAHHKMIYDENDNPVDYIFLEVNKKFEEITGFDKENIVGKRATEVLKELRNNPFDWIQFYGEIAFNKGSKTVEQYFKPLDKWFKVTAFSNEKHYFTTLFEDITERKQEKIKLENEKQRLNNIFNNLNDIIWSITWPTLEVQFISKVVEDIVGYTIENFKKDPMFIQKITHPKDKEINAKALEKLANEGFVEREFRVISKDGSIKWIKDKSKMFYDKNNNPIRVEGVMRDITRRKKAEKKLKYRQKMYRTIFNLNPIGIIVENGDGDILEVNQAECDMTGYSKEEIEGTNVLDKFVLPEDKELAKENIKKIINGQDLELDIKTPKKNGDIIYMHLKETNITFPNGKKGIISMHIDITERKEMEKELKMLDFTINKADMMILRVTPDGIIEYVNETVLDKLNYSAAEIIGLEVKQIIDEDEFVDRQKYWQSLKNTGSKVYEIILKTKGGKLFPVEVVGQFFKFNDKEYEFAFVHDISDRKEKEQEIKYLLNKDALTDLYNRRFFEEELKRLDTKRELPISIIMGDVNGLKIINDSYGHKQGDKMLVETARVLKGVIREEDILARHGGDEFTILLPKTSHKQAQKIIDRIKEKSKVMLVNNIPVSISLGVATKNEQNEKIENILKKADNHMYRNKLSESKSTKSKIVENLLNTLEAKSSETKEHAVRMTNLAKKLGEKIGLSNSEINRLSLLATLHDIGKTTISEDILTKEAKLTKREWKIIKEHTERGYKIASASEEFAVVAEEILYHHERWDGKGYPEGLKGKQIPYLSRIISIIDAYDVMTNNRPYSKAISKKQAIKEIRNCAKKQFDPKLAEEFINMQKSELP
ncbi:MAG TPA: PAS domain S-box protein [Halanaerobiales bacterium]|nr:PAS domain S-box protein [Halanaerobiales bacterium]